MKVGDLVQVTDWVPGGSRTGIIVLFKSFERGKNPQPIVMIDGRLRLYGECACEVISGSM